MKIPELTTILPLLGVFAAGMILYVVKIMIDRSRNIKRATDHVWVEIWPVVGKVYSYLTPILEGGTARIQDRHGNEFARYKLSEGAAKKADWPPGRVNFVQVTLDKVIYREGDTIPMSVMVSDRPTLDAHQLDALIENVAIAAAEATRISLEESKGTVRKTSPYMYMYLLLGAIAIGVVYVIVTQNGLKENLAGLTTSISSNMTDTLNRIGFALGVK